MLFVRWRSNISSAISTDHNVAYCMACDLTKLFGAAVTVYACCWLDLVSQRLSLCRGCRATSLTFLSNFSTSVACSSLRSRSSFWISRIQVTRRTYGLWLVRRNIPGSLSDFSISDVNKKSPLPRLPLLSLSPVLSRCLRRLLEKLSLSRLFCRLRREPMLKLPIDYPKCFTCRSIWWLHEWWS